MVQRDSFTLFGDVIHIELIHLCTAFMLIRYHTEFEIVFEELGTESEFNVIEPMHFITVG